MITPATTLFTPYPNPSTSMAKATPYKCKVDMAQITINIDSVFTYPPSINVMNILPTDGNCFRG
jgi:hypothetical protein